MRKQLNVKSQKIGNVWVNVNLNNELNLTFDFVLDGKIKDSITQDTNILNTICDIQQDNESLLKIVKNLNKSMFSVSEHTKWLSVELGF